MKKISSLFLAVLMSVAASVAEAAVWPAGNDYARSPDTGAIKTAATRIHVEMEVGAVFVALNGTHVPPFATWETAATNIQDAVDAAPSEGTVYVDDGIYDLGGRPAIDQALTNRICIEKAVTVRGAYGAAGVIVRGAWHAPDAACGAGAVRGVYLGDPGARLVNITVEGGATSDEGEMDGGGVYCASSEASASGCVVSACTAAGNGGGVWGGSWSDSQISGNVAEYGGGAYAGTLERCSLTMNSASYGGGSSECALDDSSLSGNTASQSGGGCFGGWLFDCLLTNNVAEYGGGYSVSWSESVGELYRCRVWDNRAHGEGGGVYGGTLYSCVVAGNSAAQSGGGTYSSTLESCSVLGNTSLLNGGGCYGCLAYNSIIYYNEAITEQDIAQTECVSCCTPGTGTVTAPPRVSGFHEPHLLSGSPCIDAGIDSKWMNGPEGFDMDGEARIVNEDTDIGASETGLSDPAGPLAIEAFAETLAVTIGYAQQFRAEISGQAAALFWDFGDGTGATNQNPLSHAFTGTGTFTVRVTASNDTFTATADLQIVVSVGNVFVALDGTHQPPFATWTTAATNIQDAVDLAPWGGTVHVADGIYDVGGRPADGQTLTNRVCIEKPVTLRGENGPVGVVVRGAWHAPEAACGMYAVRGVYLGHREARLMGVNVDGGATDEYGATKGGGVFSEYSEACASNCVVTACTAADHGGGVSGGLWLDCQLIANVSYYGGGGANNAELRQCELLQNMANWDGGGAIFCTLEGTIVEGNLAINGDGGGAYYCNFTRSVISDNTAGGTGGGVNGGTVVSCLVMGNRAYQAGGVAGSELNNSTVVANEANYDVGGMGWSRAINSIIWGNVAPVTSNAFESECSFCATVPIPEDSYDLGCNVDDDPQFVNSAAGNFRLLATSPCINAGTNMPWIVGETDLDGRERFSYDIVDMGAYEYLAAAGYAALGTPIEWLDVYFDGPDWDALELEDPDGDGFLTWEEYVAATDPTDENSLFAISATGRVGSDLTVSFDTAAGRVYTVQGSAGLGAEASWSGVAAPVAGNGSRITVYVPVVGESCFYRVRVSLP